MEDEKINNFNAEIWDAKSLFQIDRNETTFPGKFITREPDLSGSNKRINICNTIESPVDNTSFKVKSALKITLGWILITLFVELAMFLLWIPYSNEESLCTALSVGLIMEAFAFITIKVFDAVYWCFS